VHPALLPILAVSYLPLAWRRREWTEALAVVASAVTLFFAPVLLAPDAVPSPSAILGKVAPWQGTLDPADGNLHLVDVTHQVEPWLLFLRAEYRQGRLPFWDPFQFSGEPFWSNGSSAPLFPLHLLLAVLPLTLGLTLLPWIRLVAGGLGAWALARELGVSRPAAWLAGVAYPLSGMIVSWALFPMGNAHPLVPWAFWAVERLVRGRCGWRPLAVLAGLQLLAGHPETPVFTALLTGVYLLARGREAWGSLRVWVGFVAAWATGLALAAVQILPLAWTIFDSAKWQEHTLPTAVPLATKMALLSRAILPKLFGRAGEGTWWGPFNDPATALYAGALVLPLAALGVARLRRDSRWRAVTVTTVFALVAAYHLLGAGWLLPRLPVVGMGLHHYLKLGLELGLALLAAAGLERALAERTRRLPWDMAALVAVWLVALWLVFHDDWPRVGLVGSAVAWSAWAVVAACLVAVLAGTRSVSRPVLVALLVAGVTAVDLSVAHRSAMPLLPASSLYPATPATEALQDLAADGGRVAGVGTAFRPDAAMVFRVRDVRGDSPLKSVRYERVYGALATPHPYFFRPVRQWDDPWLDRLGLRWVVGSPGRPAPRPDWTLAFDGPDARIWRRPGARSLVRWSDGSPADRPLRVTRADPGRWVVEVGPGPPQTLVVAETWDAGWSAGWEGERLAVDPWEELLVSVRIPREGGLLALTYRPRGLGWGAAFSLAGLAMLAPWRRLRFHPRRRGDRVVS
jgi:hypothetical protein